VFGSLGFWVTFAVVVVAGIVMIVRHERARYRRPTQHRGVNPGDPDTQIITNHLITGTKVHYVTSDPQTLARSFVPPDQKT